VSKIQYIKFDKNSGIPKYKQLVNSITDGIRKEQLKIGDKIPSINFVSSEYEVSRNTVERAYAKLRSEKIVESIKGKGFYVVKSNLRVRRNILFLVNQVDAYNVRLLNIFKQVFGKGTKFDLDTYNGELIAFKEIINRKKSQYEHFVIVLNFKNILKYSKEWSEGIIETLRGISKEKLILLDQEHKQLSGQISQVYQDFRDNFYKSMMNGISDLKKYKKLILIYSDDNSSNRTVDLVTGIKRFCTKHQLAYEITNNGNSLTPVNQEYLYIVFEDLDLIQLMNKIKETNYQLGEDIGIIAYGDTPLKKYLEISVIETNFDQIANTLSELFLQEIAQTIKINFDFVSRNST